MTSPLQYGRVEDWIGGLVMDGLDNDDLPDDVALTGTVKLEPALAETSGGIRVPTIPKWLSVQPVVCSYINGRLTHRGLPYVMLLAPNEATNPTNWKWQASFDIRLNGSQIVRKQFAFVLPVYDPDAVLVDGRNPTVVNLTTVQPVNIPGSGTGVVQGPQGYSIRGVELLDEGIQFLAEAAGGTLIPVGEPVPLPDGAEVADDSVDAAKLAPAIREKVTAAITASDAAAAFVEKWKALTPYAAGKVVMIPSGKICTRNSQGTSRASFDSTELALWTPVVSESSGPALVTNPSREGFFVIPSGSGLTESPSRPGVFVIGA